MSLVSVGEIISSGSSQYLVLEMMGAGGCGHVFKCKNMKTDDLVVLKLPSSDETVFTSEEEVHVYDISVVFLSHPSDDLECVMYLVSIGKLFQENILPQSSKHHQILGEFSVQRMSVYSTGDFTQGSPRSGGRKFNQNAPE